MYTKRRVPPSEIRAGAKLAINKFQQFLLVIIRDRDFSQSSDSGSVTIIGLRPRDLLVQKDL